jgi:hypothetical protein
MLSRFKSAVFRTPPQPKPSTIVAPPNTFPRTCAQSMTPNPSASLERSYCRHGFATISGAFSAEEINRMRGDWIGAYPKSAPFSGDVSGTALFGDTFSGIFRNERMIGGLRKVLGDDFVFVNEFSLQDSCFGGWHTDTSSAEGKGGHSFHWSPTFMVTNVAVYLQDNGEFGGGLDVVPGSYIHDDPLAKQIRREKGLDTAEYADEEGDPYHGGVTVATKAGDVLMFHLRTRHRASPAVKAPSQDDQRKLALFLIAGPNNASTRRYSEWLDEYAQISGHARPTVPESFRAQLSGLGLSIV